MSVARVKLIAPFTPMEAAVVEGLGEGQSVRHVAHALGVAVRTVRNHALNAAHKIPGTLSTLSRIDVYWRGGTIEQLHLWASIHAKRRGGSHYPCQCGRCTPSSQVTMGGAPHGR